MMSDQRARAEQLRRLAERQGMTLRSAPEGAEGGFQLIAPGGQKTVTGDALNEYNLSLDDVEAMLTNDETTPQAQVVSSPDHTRESARGAETRTGERDDPERADRGS